MTCVAIHVETSNVVKIVSSFNDGTIRVWDKDEKGDPLLIEGQFNEINNTVSITQMCKLVSINTKLLLFDNYMM